jgi:hypothetical protein
MRLGPGQSIAINTVEHNNKLFAKGIQVVYRWVPSHKGVEGNQKADEKAKATALGEEKRIKAITEDTEECHLREFRGRLRRQSGQKQRYGGRLSSRKRQFTE